MRIALVCLVLSLLALATCAREDGNPDPAPQVLVPCIGQACPPDAGIDAGAVDSPLDTP